MKSRAPFLCGICKSDFNSVKAVCDHTESKHPNVERTVIYKKVMVFDRKHLKLILDEDQDVR